MFFRLIGAVLLTLAVTIASPRPALTQAQEDADDGSPVTDVGSPINDLAMIAGGLVIERQCGYLDPDASAELESYFSSIQDAMTRLTDAAFVKDLVARVETAANERYTDCKPHYAAAVASALQIARRLSRTLSRRELSRTQLELDAQFAAFSQIAWALEIDAQCGFIPPKIKSEVRAVFAKTAAQLSEHLGSSRISSARRSAAERLRREGGAVCDNEASQTVIRALTGLRSLEYWLEHPE